MSAVVLLLVNGSLSLVVVQLTANSTCITVMQTMTLIVDKLKPAFVTSYRYYDVGESLTTSACLLSSQN